MAEQHVLVDFVAHDKETDLWRMVLVEQGPWPGAIDVQLRRLQDRLYQCIDAALDGQLALKFPDSIGKKVVVQVDGYDLPSPSVTEFFERFTHGVFKASDYKQALIDNPFVSDVTIELNLQ